MIKPMDFLSHIKHEECDPIRTRMARLALNIYFDSGKHPFDLSELGRFGVPSSLAIAMAAIAWVHSQDAAFIGQEPRNLTDPFIHPMCERWLMGVAQLENPLIGLSPV